MWKALLVAVVIAGAFAAETNETKTGGTKDETASGHFYGNSGYGYNPPPPPGYGWGNPWGPPAYTPPIVDDYVCDIDASILVVTNADRDTGYGNGGGYGSSPNPGYGAPPPPNPYGAPPPSNPYGGNKGYTKPNADRLKCSIIANFNEATCTSCCRIAARRDRSVASSSIIGFIVDETQLDYDQNDNNGPYRVKRGAAAPAPPPAYGVPGVPPPHGPPPPRPPPAASPPYPFIPHIAANPLGPNARCVCCAPRKFGIPHFHPQPRPSYPY